MADESGAEVKAAEREPAGSLGRRLTLAVTFLTGVPLPVRGAVAPADLWASMGWHPLVGLGLGAAAWGAYAGLLGLLPPPVAATLVVLLLEGVTRGLHMDGLMDTCDGILSGAPRERALEIMKDSSVGAMGVVGGVLIIVLKVAALGALTRADAAAPLLVGWTAARTLSPVNVYFWPYARSSGTAEPFTRDHTLGPVVLSGVLLVGALVAAALVAVAVDGSGAWFAGLAVAAVGMGVALLAQAAVAKRLGGMTGDVYGLGIEIAEAIALVVGCAIVRLAG